MPRRFSRLNYLRTINTIKHVRDVQGGIAVAGSSNTIVAQSDDNPTLANTFEVETGSVVKSIYLKVEMNATTSAALSNAYLIVYKNPGGNLAALAASANTIGSNDNKRFVFHQEMVMFQQQDGSNPRTLFQGVIRIPKNYQRMGPNDEITVGLKTPGVAVNFCLQCIYKELR